ncbi:hypothetical protein D9M68_917930 [compost metagenome]
MCQQGLADLAGQVAALEQGADRTGAGAINCFRRFTELAAFADGNHQGGGFQGFWAGAFDNKFHGVVSPRQRVGIAG